MLSPIALYLLPRSLLTSFESPIKITYFKELASYRIRGLWIVLLLNFIQTDFMSIPISFTWVMILWFGLRNYSKIFKKKLLVTWFVSVFGFPPWSIYKSVIAEGGYYFNFQSQASQKCLKLEPPKLWHSQSLSQSKHTDFNKWGLTLKQCKGEKDREESLERHMLVH